MTAAHEWEIKRLRAALERIRDYEANYPDRESMNETVMREFARAALANEEPWSDDDA